MRTALTVLNREEKRLAFQRQGPLDKNYSWKINFKIQIQFDYFKYLILFLSWILQNSIYAQ